MGIVLFFKKRAEKAKEERQEFCKKALLVFYSKVYEKKDYGQVALPHFIKAEIQIKALEERGLIVEAYRQLHEAGYL